MTTCYNCDSPLQVATERRPLQMGDRTAEVEHEFMKCPSCGEEVFTPEQLDRVQRRASDEIRRQEGLLLAGEIRRIREQLGLSQRAFERLLGAGPKTAVRWERGSVFQNRTTDNLIRVVARFPSVAEFLAEKADVRLGPNWGGVPAEAVVNAAGVEFQLKRS